MGTGGWCSEDGFASEMSIARRKNTHAFEIPIFASSFAVEIDHSSPTPAAGQMTQVHDSIQGRDY